MRAYAQLVGRIVFRRTLLSRSRPALLIAVASVYLDEMERLRTRCGREQLAALLSG